MFSVVSESVFNHVAGPSRRLELRTDVGSVPAVVSNPHTGFAAVGGVNEQLSTLLHSISQHCLDVFEQGTWPATTCSKAFNCVDIICVNMSVSEHRNTKNGLIMPQFLHHH